jgi:hypothetical protein
MKFLRILKWSIYPLNFRYKKNSFQLYLKNKFGGHIVDKSILLKYKKSNKLFILGTGQSINNFTKGEWDEIKNNDSIGINDFCHKKFATTFYSFELERQNRQDHLNRWKKNSEIILNNFEEFREVKFFMRPYDTEDEIIKKLLSRLKHNKTLYWQQIDTLPGKDISELNFFIKLYLKLKMFKNNDYFPSRGSSLSWILGLVAKLEYEEVILCGIDLYGDHFTKNEKPLTNTDLQNVKLHETASSGNQINVLDIVQAYHDLYKTSNIKMSVSTKYSLLATSLNIYFKNL